MNFEWAVQLDGSNYKVEFIQSPLSGKRTLLVNGEVVVNTQSIKHVISARGWTHFFSINDHYCMFTMQSKDLRWHCNLFIDEEIIEPRISNPFPLRTFLIRLLFGELFLVILFTFLFYGIPTLIRGPGWIEYSAFEMAGLIVGWSTAIILVMVVVGALMTVTYRPTANDLIRGAVLLMAGWVFVTSILFWAETNNKDIGIVEAIRYGLPGWWILIPILSAFTLVGLSLNTPGIATLVVPSIWIISGMTIFTIAPGPLAKVPMLSKGTGWNSFPLVAMINFFMSLIFAQGATLPPPTSWFARLQYFGAYLNYLGLYQFAVKYRLEVAGPSLETSGAIHVKGTWNGRDIYLATDSDGFKVSISAHQILWPFEITPGIKFPEREDDLIKEDNNEAVEEQFELDLIVGNLEDTKGKEFPLLLWAPTTIQQKENLISSLEKKSIRAKSFFTRGTRIWSSGYHINFNRVRAFRINIGYAELIQLIQWMVSVLKYMEENAYYILDEEQETG